METPPKRGLSYYLIIPHRPLRPRSRADIEVRGITGGSADAIDRQNTIWNRDAAFRPGVVGVDELPKSAFGGDIDERWGGQPDCGDVAGRVRRIRIMGGIEIVEDILTGISTGGRRIRGQCLPVRTPVCRLPQAIGSEHCDRSATVGNGADRCIEAGAVGFDGVDGVGTHLI